MLLSCPRHKSVGIKQRCHPPRCICVLSVDLSVCLMLLSRKRCVLELWLLQHTNRKSHRLTGSGTHPSPWPYGRLDKSSAVAEMGDRGHNRHGSKRGGMLCAFRGALGTRLIAYNVVCAEVYFRTKWHLHPSSRLATIV